MSFNWFIDWTTLFSQPSKNNMCKVRCLLKSSSINAIGIQSTIGSVRASLQSNSSNITNGFNLGELKMKKVYNANYLELNSLDTEGISMFIPTYNTNLTITLLDLNENPITYANNIQIWLYFDII